MNGLKLALQMALDAPYNKLHDKRRRRREKRRRSEMEDEEDGEREEESRREKYSVTFLIP